MDSSGAGDYESECWPKQSNWFDYLNKNTREYVASLYKSVPEGSKDPENYIWNERDVMVWNDMNEPACFNQTEATISKNTLHNFIPDDPIEESQIVEHRAVHNVYGLFNSMTTAKGQLERTEGHDRVFSLSRSFFAGSQQYYTAVWTADCRYEFQY